MNRLERWSLHLAALLTALSGLLYGWTRYFGGRMGEFGPEVHPWQGALQHVHILASPLLLFALGLVVKGHALPAQRSGKRDGRRSGVGILILLTPLALSGYLLQIGVDPAWRRALAWIHGPLALLFLGTYLGHLIAARLRRAPLRPAPFDVMMDDPRSRSSVG